MLRCVCPRYSLPLVLLVVGMPVTLLGGESAPLDGGPSSAPLFERDVVPILNAYCVHCHGWVFRKAGLDMRSLPLLLKGGKSGPAIERGSAEHSLLFQKLTSGEMPPTGKIKEELSGKDLIVANVVPTDEHRRIIKTWIDAGAPARYEGGPVTEAEAPPLTDEDRSWWAFQKPLRHRPPTPVSSSAIEQAWHRVRTAVDAFVLDRLVSQKLTLNRDASPAVLMRRVHFDLTGLPPSPAEVEAYLADSSPVKFQRLIDRLLASPSYGERWSQPWLDAAGYSEIRGRGVGGQTVFFADGIWRYRDYVIQSWNQDKPYNRFLTEQLAGDEMVQWRDAETFTPEMKQMLIATGFLRLASDWTAPNNNGDLDAAPIRHQVLNDTLEILGTNLLGLTLQCAQCHSHKFDPVSQADYYQLRALLTPAFNPQNWLDYVHRFQYEVSPKAHQRIIARNTEIDAEVTEFKKQIDDLRATFEPRARSAKLNQIPEPIRADTEAALSKSEDGRDAIQKYLVEKLGPLLEVKSDDVTAALDEPARQKITATESQIATLKNEIRSPGGFIQALWDVGPPPTQYIFRRGQFTDPGAEVAAGVIGVLDDPEQPFELPQPGPGEALSGYRTALARWLTRPDSRAAGLTARVFVNRVWQNYFGRGIVATPGNFGQSGARPTHPRLLDWLAADFIDNGWQVKRLHRLIVSSSAYQQSSQVPTGAPAGNTEPEQIDPDNHLLWRMPLRRLDAEIIRDAVMTVSGMLDRTPGGLPVPVYSASNGMVEITEANVYRWSLEKESIVRDPLKLETPTSRYRRSVYLFARRNYHLTELAVFDQPLINTNCTARAPSVVVQQALTMLNGKFLQEQAEHFARRITGRVGSDSRERIEDAFRLVLGRGPKENEMESTAAWLEQHGGHYAQADPKLPAQQRADSALVDLCQMLLNTNEFLYIE